MTEDAIKHFARDVLGCHCPDAVFETINISGNPEAFNESPPGYLIAIGEKLLVLVIETDDWAVLADSLAGLFMRGRQLRDARHFNRFRLVVATPDTDAARQTLLQRFETLDSRDNRLHLHVIAPDQLPDLEQQG